MEGNGGHDRYFKIRYLIYYVFSPFKPISSIVLRHIPNTKRHSTIKALSLKIINNKAYIYLSLRLD